MVSYRVVPCRPCRTVSYAVVAVRHLVRHYTTRRTLPTRRAPTPCTTPRRVVQYIPDSTQVLSRWGGNTTATPNATHLGAAVMTSGRPHQPHNLPSRSCPRCGLVARPRPCGGASYLRLFITARVTLATRAGMAARLPLLESQCTYWGLGTPWIVDRTPTKTNPQPPPPP